MINKEENLAASIIVVVVLFIVIFISFIITKFNELTKDKSTPPVEDIKTIDSLKKVNNTIIIEVEHLDSIKNEKIIKVKELDNDSTAKLFYELLRK